MKRKKKGGPTIPSLTYCAFLRRWTPGRLKRWRTKHKLTQEQAAERLKTNLRTLQNWEIDRNVPSELHFRAIPALARI